MKTKLLYCTLLLISLLALSACSAPSENTAASSTRNVGTAPAEGTADVPEEVIDAALASSPYITAEADASGNIVIDTAGVTETARYVNYYSSGSIVQLILVRGSDGAVRVSLNTCQACTPSPMAYFVQDGDWFICQNCLNAFATDQVGLEQGGCNPTPVEEKTITDGIITIPAAYLDQYSAAFSLWQGPTS